MKTCIRLSLITLLAMLALGAVTSASASADEFVVEGEEVLEPTSIEGTSGLSLLVSKIGGVEVKVECTQDTSTGKLEAGGDGAATLLLKKCALTKPAHCSTLETIEGKLKDRLIGTETPEELFEASGGSITEIKVTGGECPIAGTYALKGTQKCELPKALEELAEHEVVCKKTGSSLTLAGEAASFSSTEKIKLDSGKKWSALAVQAARPESVDFRGNQVVLIDHRSNTAHGSSEAALGITEFGAKNQIEWESPKLGEVSKTWPLVYVLGEKVSLEARFAVTEATRAFLEKEVEGEPELIGETAVAGGSLSFTRKLTIEQIKSQFKEHAGYLTTEEIKSAAALVKKVAKSLATITWKWVLKEKGRANPIKQKLGESTHNFYLLFKTPVTGIKVFVTLLDLDTLEIGKEAEPLEEKKVISGVWAGFANKQKEAECLTLVCPTLRIRTYNPTNGEITRNNSVLWYYEKSPVNVTLEEFTLASPPTCAGRDTVVELLAGLTGECGAWARAFKNALATEGISSTQLRIFAKYPAGDGVCETAEACAMLVKTWGFAGGGGTSGEMAFPYTQTEVKDENGIAGQGVENPHSAFKNHQIIEVGNKLYDPSYGTEPVGNGSAGERTMNLALYQEKSLSGFCRYTGTKWNCAPAEAGKPKLGSAEETGGEEVEEEEKEAL